MSENLLFFRELWGSLRGWLRLAAALGTAAMLSSCGGDDGPSSYALNVYVSGLTGSGLQVTLNGGAPIGISANSQSTLARLTNGAAYAVAINAQPINPAQICSAANQSGKISGNNVDVMINCVSAGTPSALIIAPDQASGYSTVTLDGSSSTDSTSTISTFQWTQTVGPAVTLSTPTAAVASFIVPNVTVATNATFQVTITDASGATASSATTISLLPVDTTRVAASFVGLAFMTPAKTPAHSDVSAMDTPPMIGSTAIMEVTLGGAISTASFSLLDANRAPLGSETLLPVGNSSLHPRTYAGAFTVPAVPFFVAATGTTGDGATFSLVSPALTKPINMGLAFSPNNALLAPGATLTANVVITNPGAAAAFLVTFVDPNHLITQSNTTVNVGAGQSASLPVTITLPSSLAGVLVPTVVANASVAGDPSRSAATTFTVWVDGQP